MIVRRYLSAPLRREGQGENMTYRPHERIPLPDADDPNFFYETPPTSYSMSAMTMIVSVGLIAALIWLIAVLLQDLGVL